MSEVYKTSTDYERLWKLIQPTEEERNSTKIHKSGILCRYRDDLWHDMSKDVFGWSKREFISDCKKWRLEFIDPASQRKTPAELAAGEMCDWLNWLIENDMLTIVNPNDREKIKLVLKKARGE